MNGTTTVLRAEVARFFGARTTWVSGGLLILVPALRVGAAAAGRRIEEAEKAARGIAAIGLDAGTGWAPFVDGWRAGLVLGVALLLFQAARSTAGDRESGVLRLAVTRTASRTGALLGRALLGPLMVLLLVALTGIAAYVAASFVGDFGTLTEDEFPIVHVEDLVEELRTSLLIAALALCAVHGFGLFIGTLSRTAVVALAVSLASIILWDVFKSTFGDARWWVFASHAPTFIDGSAMDEMSGYARGYSDRGLQPQLVRMGFVVPALSYAATLAAAALVLRRRAL